MTAAPGALPVTCGAVAGVTAPAAIVTVDGEMLTLVLLLDKETIVPPAGAGAERVICKGTDCPSATFGLVSVIAPLFWTVTDVLAPVIPDTCELAVTVVVPAATPVIETLTEVAPAMKVTVEGKLTMPAGLAARLTTRPPVGAGADNVNPRFCAVAPIRVRPPVGPKPSTAPPVITVWLSLL